MSAIFRRTLLFPALRCRGPVAVSATQSSFSGLLRLVRVRRSFFARFTFDLQPVLLPPSLPPARPALQTAADRADGRGRGRAEGQTHRTLSEGYVISVSGLSHSLSVVTRSVAPPVTLPAASGLNDKSVFRNSCIQTSNSE